MVTTRSDTDDSPAVADQTATLQAAKQSEQSEQSEPASQAGSSASPSFAGVPDEVAAPATLETFKERISYLDPEHVAEVVRAYHHAERAHSGQMRRTGHLYITHPLAVADSLAEMRMDSQTLMAAILHDVIEDTAVAKTTLASEFGEEVAEMVDGLSKLSTMFRTRAEAQAENFQKMALAMTRDIRVILVKLADRRHNMRTLGALSQEKRTRIARETMELYAPIANRLGMHGFKNEFEDLAFRALYPMRAERIGRVVEKARGSRRPIMEEVEKAIVTRLSRDGIDGSVSGREKHLFSIYQKMKDQKKSFGDIMDVFGFRIVVDSVDACYRTLGSVHNLYKPVPNRFKDIIAIPKANGYQSLHTTLFGPNGVPIEIQIRTREMNTIAENGIAGHWIYKSDNSEGGGTTRAHQWLQTVLELQQRADDSLEFVESLKVDLFPDEVYVFTPKGKIMELPRGASVIDFAYAVHTDVGNTCVASRIDRKTAPLSTQLESGQTVEVVTARSGRPRPDWLSYSVTSKARAAIRHALKNQQEGEAVALGRRLLNQALANHGKTLKDFDFRRLRKVFVDFGVRKQNDLLIDIGLGNRLAAVVARRMLDEGGASDSALPIEASGPVAVKGSEGLLVTYARCCHPLPGDAIAGHMSTGRGLVVHIETCRNMTELRRKSPNEIVPVRWEDSVKGDFSTELRVHIEPRKETIAELADIISNCDAGIDSIRVEERDAHLDIIVIGCSVRDRVHMAQLMKRIRLNPHVMTLTRARG